jgi:undecaprenyl-diphosphatase
VTEFLQEYGLVVLFLVTAGQASGIPGLPGKTALVLAGILAADGYFSIWAVVAVAAVSGTLGGFNGYLLGRAGARRLIHRPALRRRLDRQLAIAERFFAAHGARAVFVARFLPGLKVVAPLTAGTMHMRWRTFALWHTLGSIGFALLFGLGAYFLGATAIELAERYGLLLAGPLVVLGAAAWLGLRLLRRRRLATPA